MKSRNGNPFAVNSHGTPIETTYKGFIFRSRVEARWAVYFDEVGIKFHYEMEGYDLSEVDDTLGYYLPDFWLPQVKMWAEVKAESFSDIEARKCAALAESTGFPCLMLIGPPDTVVYFAKEPLDLPGLTECDYIVDDQYLHENRFFGSIDLAPGCDAHNRYSRHAQHAVEVSRGLRFENRKKGTNA